MIDWLGFCVVGGGRNWLGFLGYGPQIAWFWCEHRNWLGFCLVGRYWLDFSVVDQTWPDFSLGIGIDLFCVWGSKMSWFYSMWIEIDLDLVWWCSTANRYMGSWQMCLLCPINRRPLSHRWQSSSVVLSVRNERRSGVQIPPKSLFSFFWTVFLWHSFPHNSQAVSKTH